MDYGTGIQNPDALANQLLMKLPLIFWVVPKGTPNSWNLHYLMDKKSMKFTVCVNTQERSAEE